MATLMTPPRLRVVSNTSDLSPIKYNEELNLDPERTSPVRKSPLKRTSPCQTLPRTSTRAVQQLRLGENARPQPFSDGVHYPKLPAHHVHLTEQSRTTKDRDLLAFTRSPVSGHDSRSNLGRRRANAVSLINSPPRQGHSDEMARIFRKAQETDLFRDDAKDRRPPASYMLPPKPKILVGEIPKPSDATEWSLDQLVQAPSLDDKPKNGKLSPRSGISIDKIRKPSHVIEWNSNQFAQSLSLESKSRNPNPYHEDTGEWTDDDIYCPSEYAIDRAVQARVNSHVQTWLQHLSVIGDDSDVTMGPNTSRVLSTDTPPNACVHAELISARPRNNKLPKSAGLLMSPPQKPNSGMLLLHTPAYKPARLPRRHLHRQDDNSRSPSAISTAAFDRNEACAKSWSSASDSRKENEVRFRLESLAGSDVEDSEPLVPLPAIAKEDDHIKTLSPDVMKYRKGKGPRRPRCASYFDKDIISSPGEKEDDAFP